MIRLWYSCTTSCKKPSTAAVRSCDRSKTASGRSLISTSPRYHAVAQSARSSKPTAGIYASLIARNANADNGSAANVASLLQDLDRERISISNDVCHAALRALAVHPDPVLRSQILSTMRSSWLDLSRVGWHDVIVGLLKNGQVEEALDSLDEMRRKNIAINGWLLDMTICTLCDINDHDEALRMMQDRIRSGEVHVPASSWYQLLDSACDVLHYNTLAFIWSRQVQSNYIRPASGHCLAVLQAAAKAGDVSLAGNVFHELSNREAALTSHHYELLMDAYFTSNDFKTPLNILCIMNSASIVPTQRTTRSLYQALCQGRDRTRKAFETLVELRQEKPDRAIPTAAMDTILEATLDDGSVDRSDKRHATKQDANIDTAVQRYKYLHKLCPAGPTTNTFNTLLSKCAASPGHKATAMFLASEMLYLKVSPNAATYDHLLIACLDNEQCQTQAIDYEDAFKYYQEMRERKWTPRPSTFERMVKRCALAGDQRAWVLVERMKEAGIEVEGIRRWLSTNWVSTRPVHAEGR